MNHALIALFTAAALFVGMLLFSEIGRRIGIERLARDPDGMVKGAGAAEAAVFGLLGLVIAFTFSGAASRFEARRHLITTEANAIGTAYLRIDLVPSDAQPEMRELFRRYTDTRAVSYGSRSDRAFTKAKLDETAAMQGEIWTKAMAACRRPEAPAQAAMLLLPSLNEMIDITTTRETETRNHPPLVVYLLLGGLSLIGALLVGYETSPTRRRTWFHIVVFAAIMSLAIYVILDLEFPRQGLIRVDAADQVLTELRATMR
ncbi:MAG: DUF4239 domain-containing protein [Syntrophobacteraceae bacterium]